jgi:hypothetical protein
MLEEPDCREATAQPTNDKGKSEFALTYKMMFLDNKQLLLF